MIPDDPRDIERKAHEAWFEERVRKRREEMKILRKKCEEHVKYWNEESPKARARLQSYKDQKEREKYGEKFKVEGLKTRCF